MNEKQKISAQMADFAKRKGVAVSQVLAVRKPNGLVIFRIVSKAAEYERKALHAMMEGNANMAHYYRSVAQAHGSEK